MPAPSYIYLLNQSGAASFVGAWIPCDDEISFLFSWAAVALTAGTLYVEGTNDPAHAAENIIRPDGLEWWLKSTGAKSILGNVIGTVANASSIVCANPWGFMRAGAVITAGGAADQFQAFAQGR